MIVEIDPASLVPPYEQLRVQIADLMKHGARGAHPGEFTLRAFLAGKKNLPKAEEKGLGFEPLPGPRGVADDLKKLTGVSPAIEKQLQDLGIFHYSQIAELSADAAHNVGEEVGLPGRVQGWVAKAKELSTKPGVQQIHKDGDVDAAHGEDEIAAITLHAPPLIQRLVGELVGQVCALLAAFRQTGHAMGEIGRAHV